MRALVTVSLMTLCSPAWAATLRVPSEYPSIHAAAQRADTGDTVLVAPGTYDQEGMAIPFRSGVSLISEEGWAVTRVDFGNGGLTFWHVPGVTEPSRLEGFTIGGGWHAFTHPCTVQANRLIASWANYTFAMSTVTCTFRDNIIEGGAPDRFSLFTTESSVHAVWSFERNVLIQVAPYAFGSVGGWGTQELILRNNTLVNVDGFMLNNTLQWTNIEIVNDIFYGTPENHLFICEDSPGVTYDIRYNAWWRVLRNNCPTGAGNIVVDPIFCDASHGDFRLHATSPCIGAGEGGATMGALGVGCGVMEVGDPVGSPVSGFWLEVAPNPLVAGGVLRVGGDPKAPLVVRAWDAAGRLMAEGHFGSPSASGIRLDDLVWGPGFGQTSGVIFLELEAADGRRAVTKALVVR